MLSVIGFALLLTACAAPAPSPTQEEVVEQALPETTDIALEWSRIVSEGSVKGGWLATFKDDKLEQIVTEVLQNNRGLAAASANLDIAAGLATQAGARLLPAVSVGGSSQSTARGSSNTNIAGVALNVQWELDVWGRLRAGASAAEESFRVTEADFEFARQSLVAQTAKAWFLATEANLQKQLAEEAGKIYGQIVKIAQTRVKVGKAQQQDIFLAQADLASAEERQRQTQSAFEQSVRSLETMLGRYPSAELEVPHKFIPVPPSIPVGIPAELLERRPDLRAAERQVAAAFQRIHVAKAAKLPSLALTASGGGSSNELIDLIGASRGFFSLGANFLASFDVGGELQGQVEIETAKQEAALATYGNMALRAFNEIESALSNEVLMQERESLLISAVENNESALKVAETQYEFGQVDLLSVLQMQTRVLNARIALIRIKNARLAQRVDLHLALGGSFIETN
ncbi:MAG: efflux transporter outer membrane subunit [Spongiibacteraceae bacterium]|nr:efflux transporter outer membrane subunit [Spongiibacteraceae bacterium]